MQGYEVAVGLHDQELRIPVFDPVLQRRKRGISLAAVGMDLGNGDAVCAELALQLPEGRIRFTSPAQREVDE